jgi:outer membrane protein OmpA-like peptidoglycan-associated protein
MLLIGRADPRGGQEYNFVLGDQRAQSVAQALLSLDVDEAQIHTSSRGELDATGKTPTGWAEDRRVNIKLHN